MTATIAKVLIGCLIGALIGYFGQCSSGTCPLTSTWWRGAIYGGVLGLLFSAMTSGPNSVEMAQSTKSVRQIAEGEFDAVIAKSTLPVLVDFYAPWCGPCKALAPVLDKQADEFTGKIEFLKVNVDEAADLSRKFNIQGVPTLLFFKDGKIVDTVVGGLSSDALRSRLEALSGMKDTNSGGN